MNRKLSQSAGAFVILAIVLVVAFLQREPATKDASPPAPVPTVSIEPKSQSPIGFRLRGAMEDHFQKHGREFGKDCTIQQYLKLAQSLRDAPLGGAILQQVRSDGVITRFDRKSGAFGAYNSDGTIRTFFKPNDGEAYFKRQLDREPEDR